MRKAALILVPLILVACTAQITAHEQSNPRRLDPELFEPIVIEKSTIPLIVETIIETPKPSRPPIKQPAAKMETVSKKTTMTKAVANTTAKEYALSAVGQKQFNCLEPLWQKESGWNYKALNKSSGAYGIPQALPGSKMASAGDDWRTNPITQVKWGIRYVNGRYGSACGAWNFWKNNHWY